MVNQQLLDYIKQQQAQGVAKEVINNNLLSQGWRQEDVSKAFSAAENKNVVASVEINATSIIKRRALLFAMTLILPTFSAAGMAVLLYHLKIIDDVQLMLGSSFFVLVMFCLIAFILIKFRTIKTPIYPAIPLPELKNQTLEYFSQSTDEKNIFEVSNAETELTITWINSILYNQLVSIGSQKVKIVVRVTFEENKKHIRIRTSQIDRSISLGLLGVNLNLSYQSGFWLTFKSTYMPSFSIENGKPVLKIEKLTANSLDIIGPVAQLALNGGWNVKMG